jgi:GT2 family glycosyltransferase
LLQKEQYHWLSGVMLTEEFFLYEEEPDWCYRVRQNGWKVMFAPVGKIVHFGGQSAQKRATTMVVQLRKSILQFMKKHHGPLVYRTACLLIILFLAVRLPIWSVIALFQRAQNSEAAIKKRAYCTGIANILFGRIDS